MPQYWMKVASIMVDLIVWATSGQGQRPTVNVFSVWGIEVVEMLNHREKKWSSLLAGD